MPAQSPLLDRAEATAANLPPLLVAALRIADTVAHGTHGRRRAGSGESFWQFRRFGTGDSLSAIDWRRSAKSEPLFVREYEWEAAQSVWIACDTGPSMDYAGHVKGRPRGLTKRERALELSLALASLLVRGGERIALVGADRRPALGRAALMRMARHLDRTDFDGSPKAAWQTPAGKHARVVVISDFLQPEQALIEGLGIMASRGVSGHLLQVLDPTEETLPFDGRIRFEGMTAADDSVLVNRTEDIRAGYQHRLAAHRDAIVSAARQAGWGFSVHHTDHPPQTALLSLYNALAMPPSHMSGGRR